MSYFSQVQVQGQSITTSGTVVKNVGVLPDGSLQNATIQNITVSAGNSTTDNLGSGTLFTGRAEYMLGASAIQTIMKTSVPTRMYVEQGIDGSNWDIVDYWDVNANTGDARTTTSVAPFFRVIVANNTTSASTYFRLATGMTPILEVLPRTLISTTQNPALSVSAQQNVLVSTENSSTVNLGSNAIFIGGGETTLGIAGIQINLATTQNCTVYIDQSMDNVNWDITDSFTYYYILGGNSWTTQATGSYFRVRIKNIGASTTTYFRLQTALCPMVEALPRALNSEGRLKTCSHIRSEDFDSEAIVTPMHQLRTTENVRLVGSTFTGGVLDTNFWEITRVVGTGAVSVANAQAVLTTGATAGSSIRLNSKRLARYIGASSNYYRGQIRCPAITGSNIRRWGCYDWMDGFFFEYDGTTLSVVSRKNAVDTKVSSGSFNGNQGSIYTLNINVYAYEIYYTNGSAWFVIDGIEIHKLSATTATLVATAHLKIGLECINATGNTNVNTLEVRSSTINRLGKLDTEKTSWHTVSADTRTILKYGPGQLHNITLASGAAKGDTLTMYDAIGSGTVLTSIGPSAATPQPTQLTYDLPFFTGLTYTSTGNSDWTISYE